MISDSRQPLLAVPSRLQRFARLVQRRPDEIPLAEATLEIARDEYADLDVGAYMSRMDELARLAAGADPGPDAAPRERLAALNHVLFQEAGFTGDSEHVADPRNSYLNEALDRKTGLPVTLAVIYLEIGNRLGLDLVGVGMPAHFIVRLQGEEPPLFIDPFHQGAFLTVEGCRELLHRVSGGRLELQPEYLAPWRANRILDRILHNLKAIHIQAQDYRRARRIVEQILVLRPGAVEEIRDRGILAYQSLNFEQAVADLELYLEQVPNASDAVAIKGQLQSLKRLLPSLN